MSGVGWSAQNLADLAQIERGNDRAAIRADLHESRAFQAMQRLSDGRGWYSEMARECGLA